MKKNSKHSPQPVSFTQRWLWGGSLAAVVGLLGLLATQQSVAADVVVYKSPTCGCCGKWVKHMEDAGFSVDVENRQDLSTIKSELGVPGRMQSCHTARIGGYFVEGHVPADLVKRMLDKKPDIRGLTVPGMPMGSPGMEGPRKDRYSVIAIGNDGSAGVYAQR
ncbi:MAG: DUF411 domain-containing protein [Gammaproteobacteria bacterium]|nr:DUF411 domain-containing protein [Gammaproteobacteria bacterium]